MAKRLQALVPVFLLAYFAYFAWDAMHATFALDDPTNLGHYWRRGFGNTVLDNLRFWSTAYRPMGGLFYLPIYFVFRLNPLPYRIVVMALIAANIGLAWFLGKRLTGSNAAAALAAALVCGHAGMLTIYYNTSTIYDILAFFFTALMLAVYVSVRGRGYELTRRQIAAVILAYIAAIDSKEIAVVGAGWVLAYEVLIPRSKRWATPLALTAISIIYTAGKMFGPDSLSKVGGYDLEFTLHRYFINNEKYLNSLFYSDYFKTPGQLLIAWGLLTVICALYRKREAWWCWFVISTATMGTSFTVVARDGGSLYLPLLGWALLTAVLVNVLARRPVLEWAAVALITILWGRETIHWWRETAPVYLQLQNPTWSAITQIRDLPRPRPGNRVMILNSPFDGWDAYFIAELLWNDRSIDIRMGDKAPAPPTAEELKSFDWILAFDGNRLRIVRRP